MVRCTENGESFFLSWHQGYMQRNYCASFDVAVHPVSIATDLCRTVNN